MVGVDDDHGRQIETGEPPHQIFVHPLRQDDGQPRVDSQPAHVGNPRHRPGELRNPGVRQGQRVPPGEDHF